MAIVRAENLTYCYPSSTVPALQGLNLRIEDGEFVLVTGSSGSGKSTLARLLGGLIPQFYGGRLWGEIKVCGLGVDDQMRLNRNGAICGHAISGLIGMVFQEPENQILMNDVENEIAFGLENVGCANDLIARRVGEVLYAFGLNALAHTPTRNLSSGQKQKLALASAVALKPRLLVLDEPFSQIDPVAQDEMVHFLKTLNEEDGITIVMIEHRLERCFHLADRVLTFEDGRLIADGTPEDVGMRLASIGKEYLLPPVARLFAGVLVQASSPSPAGGPQARLQGVELAQTRLTSTNENGVPLTVKEAQRFIRTLGVQTELNHPEDAHWPRRDRSKERPGNGSSPGLQAPVAVADDVWVTYQGGAEAIKGLSLSASPEEFIAIMGENGAGKTSLIKQFNGLVRPSRGTIKVMGEDIRHRQVHELARNVGYVPQNPGDLLFQATVREELEFTAKHLGVRPNGYLEELIDRLGLVRWLNSNPRDLSVGERQRVALASALLSKPRILLLDEPTRGLDNRMKSELGRILQQSAADGAAVLLVTHDVEFVSEHCERVVLMSQGRVVSDGYKTEILRDGLCYSPQVYKLFAPMGLDVFTMTDARSVLEGIICSRSS